MPNANLLTPDRHIHALLIGPSGSGKTAAACSFPGKTFVLDFDDRIKGILGCKFLNERIKSGQIEFERVMAWKDQTPQGLATVYKILELIDIRVTKHDLDNVVLDSTSSMIRFFVNESVNRDLKTSGKASSLAHFKIGEAILAQKQDYNYTATCMLNIIYDNLKTFNCNVFISSHFKDKIIAAPTEADPERTIVVGRVLAAPGQLAEQIPTWLDETWEFTIDDMIKSQPPKRFVTFASAAAKSTFLQELGSFTKEGGKDVWKPSHRLEITDKSLYEVLTPTFERMKGTVHA